MKTKTSYDIFERSSRSILFSEPMSDYPKRELVAQKIRSREDADAILATLKTLYPSSNFIMKEVTIGLTAKSVEPKFFVVVEYFCGLVEDKTAELESYSAAGAALKALREIVGPEYADNVRAIKVYETEKAYYDGVAPLHERKAKVTI